MIAMNSSPRYRNTPVGPPSGWSEPARLGANDDPRNDDFGTFTSCMLKYVSTSEQSMYCPSPVRSLDIAGQAFLRVIVLEKVRALRARLEFAIARLVAGGAAAVARWRQLQLDDLGTQLRQYPRASRAGDELGDVEHAIAREHRQFGTHRLLAALIRKENVRDGRPAACGVPNALRLPCRQLRGQPPPAAVRAAQAGRNPRTARPRTGRKVRRTRGPDRKSVV